MFGLEPWHIALVLVAVLVIFGPKRLPEIGKNLGESIREFRKATTEFSESVKAGVTEPVPLATQSGQAAAAAPQAAVQQAATSAPQAAVQQAVPDASAGAPASAPTDPTTPAQPGPTA